MGTVLFKAHKQNVLDEQVQMTRLLESLARTEILQYPVCITHTGITAVPDFQLESGTRHIAVEITKIALQDVEHASALQQKGLNRAMAISTLYRKKSRPRGKEEVIAEAFGTPAMLFPVSTQEHDQAWYEQAEASLTAKSAVLARPDFVSGDENWLLLWDRIGTREAQLPLRQERFAHLLANYWAPGWFSRVFLQDENFFWQVMFQPSGTTPLPVNCAPT